MPVICHKHYTITVNPVAYYAYFKLDEASAAATLVNQVDAFPFVSGDPSNMASVPGKIGTAIMQVGGFSQPTYGDSSSPHWRFTGSFTIRIWFKWGGGTGFFTWFSVTPAQWSFFADTADAINQHIGFMVDTNPGGSTVESANLTLGWNHVMAWFESGVGAGIKINNGAAVLDANVNPINPVASASIALTLNEFDAFDEIAMWNRKLTDAEMTADWNGGAGVTYP